MDEMWWGLVFLDNTSHFLSFQNLYVLLFFLKNMFMQALLFRQPTNFYRSFSNAICLFCLLHQTTIIIKICFKQNIN